MVNVPAASARKHSEGISDMRVIVMQRVEGIAGSERYLLSILPALLNRGVDASFLMVRGPQENQSQAQFLSDLAKAGVKTHVIETGGNISPTFFWKLRALIAREKTDILHTNLIFSDVYGAIVKLAAPRRFALVSGKHGYSDTYQTAHGFDPGGLRWNFLSLSTWLAARPADSVFSISSGLARLLTEGGLANAEKMRVIPYGFDFDKEPSYGPVGKYRFAPKQIVSISRLVPVKQLHILISAMPILTGKFPDLKLVLVGDGSQRRSLEELARAKGVADKVIFEGFQNNVLDYIRDSDIFALPSAAEGFGRVILEAWWHRKPVVCFDVPAPNEIVTQGHDGILVPERDEAAFVRALDHLLTHPAEAERLGDAGRQTYDANYTLDVMVDRTLALYSDMLAVSASSRVY